MMPNRDLHPISRLPLELRRRILIHNSNLTLSIYLESIWSCLPHRSESPSSLLPTLPISLFPASATIAKHIQQRPHLNPSIKNALEGFALDIPKASRLVAAWMCVYFQKEAMVCIDDASAEGRLDIITLLHRGMKGRDVSPWGSIMDKASERGHLRIVRFLHIEGGTCTTFAMDKAAENGHLDVVKFLYENRQEGCTPIAMWTALSRGHVGVVKFLCEAKGMDVCIGDEDVAVAAQRGYVDLVEFLTQLIVKRRTILASESITMDCAAEKGHV